MPGETPPTDAELIAMVRAGDRRAYGPLYERHRAAALRVARHFARDAAGAEDLVNEAFTRVLAALDRGNGPDEAFRAYLHTTLRRTAFDWGESERRVRLVEDVSELEVTATPVSGADRDPLDEAYDRQLAARAFHALPERWQVVIWHLEVEGESPADVAPLLDLEPAAVSALAYRAREGLRQAFLQAHLAETVSPGCQPHAARLAAFVRGRLGARDTAKLERHLDTCERCTGLYLEVLRFNEPLGDFVAPLVFGAAAAVKVLAGVGGGSVAGAAVGAAAAGVAAAGGVGAAAGVAAGGAAVGVAAASGAAGGAIGGSVGAAGAAAAEAGLDVAAAMPGSGTAAIGGGVSTSGAAGGGAAGGAGSATALSGAGSPAATSPSFLARRLTRTRATGQAQVAILATAIVLAAVALALALSHNSPSLQIAAPANAPTLSALSSIPEPSVAVASTAMDPSQHATSAVDPPAPSRTAGPPPAPTFETVRATPSLRPLPIPRMPSPPDAAPSVFPVPAPTETICDEAEEARLHPSADNIGVILAAEMDPECRAVPCPGATADPGDGLDGPDGPDGPDAADAADLSTTP